jgi:4-amino-4-deoxy-L-arabinose transferase-like glycosyltransferase
MKSIPGKASASAQPRAVESDRRRWTRADSACVAAIVLLSTAYFMPTMSRPLSSSHDGKAGLIVRQMIEQHRWFVADVEVCAVNKPPVYYWVSAGLSALRGGVNEWTVRLPSLLACVLTAVMTWVLARELWDRWTGLVCAAVLVTLAQFHLLAQTAHLDAPVALSVVAAVYFFWRALNAPGGAWSAKSWGWSAAGYLSLAAGAAVKGPVGVVLAGLALMPVLAVRWVKGEGRPFQDLLRLHPVSGTVILVGVVAPVFYGMQVASQGHFLNYFVLHENLARAGLQFADAEEFHRSYSFWTYFGTIWFVAAPWSLFLPAALALGSRREVNTSRAATLLPLFFFALPFLFLSAVSVKKWSYLMPACPALAMLCGKLWTDLIRGELGERGFARWLLGATSAALVAVAIAASLGVAWLSAPDSFRTLVGPEGLIRTPKVTELEPELRAITDAGTMQGAVPIMALMAAVVVAAAFLQRRNFRTAFAFILVIAVAGTLYHDFVIEPRCVPAYSQQGFTRRVERWLTEHPGAGASPIYVCAGEPYEFLFYFKGSRRVIADPEVEGFLSRIRPPESSEAGTPVEVVFSRVTFEEARKKAGSLSEQLATGEREAIDAPLVLTTVKLAGE